MRAVESVLVQSYREFELLIVDDGSTDGTESAVAECSDSRIRYERIDHTGMPGAVRNRGIGMAEHDWLGFLDSDDIWYREKLESQLAVLHQHPGTVVIHTRERWNRNGTIISQRKQRHQRRGDIFRDAVNKCIIGPSTVLLHRSVFDTAGWFRDDMEIAEDYELWLRVTACYPVEYVDEPMVEKFAGHGEQLSEKYGQIEIFRLKGLQDLVDRRWFHGDKQGIAVNELARKCLIHAKGCRKRGKEEEYDFFFDLYKKYSK